MPLPDGMREAGVPLPPRKPFIPPHIKQSHLTIPWHGLRYAGYVAVCILAAVLCFAAGRGCNDFSPVPPIPAPTPAGKLRVIMVSDSVANMTKGQLAALNSTAVRTYLNAHCEKDPDGRAAWRDWPSDVDPKGETKVWQDLWADIKPKLTDLPQVAIFVGQKGKTYPVPDSEGELINLLKRYGGD